MYRLEECAAFDDAPINTVRTNTNAGTGGLFLSNAEFKGFNGQVLQDKCCGISQLYVSVNYRESKSLIADFTDSFYVAVPSPEP